MGDEPSGQFPPRKRLFSSLLASTSFDKPTKQRKRSGSIPRGKQVSGSIPIADDGYGTPPVSRRTATEPVNLINSEPEITGRGTKIDPFRFPTWEMGNVISRELHGSVIDLLDDDVHPREAVSRKSSLDALNAGSSILGHTAKSASERTTLSVEEETEQQFPAARSSMSRLDSSVDNLTPASQCSGSTFLGDPSSPCFPASERSYTRSPSPLSPKRASSPTTRKSPVSYPYSLEELSKMRVKLETYRFQGIADIFADEEFSDCETTEGGGDTGACCNGVPSKATTDVKHHSQEVFDDGYPCPDPQSRDEDEEYDCVIVFERTRSPNLAGPLFGIKSEPEEEICVPDRSLTPEGTAAKKARQPDPFHSLFSTDPIASETCTSSTAVSAEVDHPAVSRVPVELAEGIDWNKPLPIATRKRLFFDTYHRLKRSKIEKILAKFEPYIRGDRSPDKCWLYTGPRLPKPPAQGLSMNISFIHNGHRMRLSLNVLIVKMLFQGNLSEEHINGIVDHSWHASHLCGNWTCFNTSHIVPEPGSVNMNRNVCFRDVDGPCSHTPKCMKWLKLDKSLLGPEERATTLEAGATEGGNNVVGGSRELICGR